mmetsp:Transcript_31605/g.62490  ORF Transcript_31605/g.62490 Transcript_31605/m.62490 type:complete len:100 (+) Transcript_31605:2497-2796(+)
MILFDQTSGGGKDYRLSFFSFLRSFLFLPALTHTYTQTRDDGQSKKKDGRRGRTDSSSVTETPTTAVQGGRETEGNGTTACEEKLKQNPFKQKERRKGS